MGLFCAPSGVTSSRCVFACVFAVLGVIAAGTAHSGESFRQTLWASTNHAVHSIDADTGELLVDAVGDSQARSVEVDLRRVAVWAYGQGRLTRHGLDGSVEFDLDVPGTSPSSSASGNGTGNGGERLQDLEVTPDSGDVWLAVKRELYRYSLDGELLEQWVLDADARGLAVGPEASGIWLLTRDALYHVSPGAEILTPTDVPSDKPWIELSAGAGDTLWLAGQDHLYRLNAEGEATVSLAVVGIRQIAAGETGGAWYADDKTLVHLDREGLETTRFDHKARARTVDLELDPRDGTPWLASQKDIVHFDTEGTELLGVPVKTLGASARLWDIEPGIDATPPQLAWLSPEPGACLATAQPELAFSYSDTESGVNRNSPTLYHQDTILAADCEAGEESATCTPTDALPEGDQTIDAQIADWAGNLSEKTSLSIHIDAIPPEITITGPANGSETFAGQTTIMGQLSEPVPLLLNGSAVELDDDLSFSVEVTLQFGENAFAFEASDCAGNTSQTELTITRKRSPPEFVSTPPTSVRAGELYEYPSSATDPDPNDQLEYFLVIGPEGMTMDSTSGQVEWQTDDGDIGLHDMEIGVVDQNGDEERQAFVIEVSNPNRPPTANPQSLETQEGIAIDLTLTGQDPDGDALSYRILSGPTHGRAIGDPPNIRYVPDAYYDGNDQFLFVVYDGEVESDPAPVDIVIGGKNNPPRIISEPVTPHVFDSDLGEPEPQVLRDWEFFKFPSTHPNQPIWEFSRDGMTATQKVNAPPSIWLGDFDSTNKHIEGTWHLTGHDDDNVGFVIGYQNPYQFYWFGWKKNAQNLAARGYSFYRFDLAADGSEGETSRIIHNSTNGFEHYYRDRGWFRYSTYDYEVDFRPSGIRVSIKEDGDLIDAFQVSDERFQDGRFGIYNSSMGGAHYTVSVSDLGSSKVYWYEVEAVDPDGDDLTYRLVKSPDGVWINQETGTIRWETDVEDVGRYPITIEVEDEHGATARQVYDLIIQEEQPVITGDPPAVAYVGEEYRYLVSAIDPNPEDTLTFSLISGPGGAGIDPASGMVSWVPTLSDVGAHEFLVRVTDSLGVTDEQSFTVNVTEKTTNEPPYFVSEPPEVAYVGEVFRYAPKAVDPDGDPVQYGLTGDLPYHMQIFDGENLTWQPGEDQIQNWTITVDARDGNGGLAQQTFTIQVQDATGNTPPSISSTPINEAEVDGSYEYQVQAGDPDGDPLSITLVEAPSGMAVDSVSGLVSWRPGTDDVAFHEVTIRVEDGRGGYAEQSYQLEVVTDLDNGGPVIESTPSASALVDMQYRYDVQATDPEGDPLTYTLAASPGGMGIDGATGSVTWTPTSAQVGEHSVIVVVSDGRGGSARQSYTLAVIDGTNQAPTITSTPNTVAATEAEYTYQIEASDPDGDTLTHALTASPTGMAIDSTSGLVTWTPTVDQTGEHTVTVEVSDGRGGVATQSYTLAVNENGVGNQPPGITSTPPLTARTGQAYSYQVEASDPDGDTLGYALADSPAGMSITADGGLVEWTPTDADFGDHAVVIEVQDGRGGVARQDYTLSVVDGSVNNPPQIFSAPPVDAKAGYEYRYTVVAEDPEGDPINYTLIDSPAGMSVDPAGEIRWTPETTGEVPVTVRADDGQAYEQQSWTVSVAPEDTELAVEVFADPAFVDPGEPVTVTVTPSGMAGQYSLATKLDDETLVLDEANQAVVTLDEIGEHQVSAALSDDFDSVTDTTSFTVRDPDANPPPVVKLTEPGHKQEVTAPIDIVGSVDDDNLESWLLAIRPRDNPNAQPQVLAEGSATFTEQTIAPFDPTQLTNGLYTVVLQATDLSGQTEFDSRVVRVTGDLKVGNFSITFEDVSIPLAGIPVRVTRTYDSRRRFESLDFGQGWSVDYQNGRVQESRTVGFGWDLYEYDRGFFSDWCVQPNGAPVVTVNLGDGELRTFEARAEPECQQYVPQTDVHIVFEPVDGTDAELEQLDFGLVRLVEGNIVDLGAPEEPIDPDNYRLTTADGMVYMLDQSFGVRRVIEPGGNEITFSEAGITHSNGVGVDFVRDAQGRIGEILLPDGESLTYQYDANGDLVGMTDQLGQAASYTYDANFPHYLRDILDPRGVRVTRNEYDADGRLVATIDADGNRIEYDHDIEGQREHIRDRRGNLTTYVYDDQGRVLTETNALGETTTHTYNAEGFELTRTDPLGNTTEWTYDERGNKLTQTNPMGETTAMAYSERNRLLSQTAPDGTVVMSNTYDPNSLDLTSTTDALGNTTTFTYDTGIGSGETGQLLSTTDALGNETTHDYDASGYLRTETDPLGTQTRYVRDSVGRVLEERTTRTLADGTVQDLVTTHIYDAKGRRTQTTRPDGSTTTTTYNALDKVAERCDARGHCTSYEYDDQARRVKTIHPDGTTETVAFDVVGNEIARTDRAGRTTKKVYDAADRLVETIYPDDTADDSDNPRETRAYDAAGRLVAVTNERGHTTTYEYDDAGRRTAVVDSLGNRTDFILDERGRQVAVMDADGHLTRYTYDGAGRRIATIFADDTPSDDTDNPRAITEYDALGRKIAETDEVGQTKRLKYDALGRLIEVIEPDPVTGETPLPSETGGIRTRYSYDEQGNKLTQTDALGRVTRWTYDALGRVTSRELPLGQVETFAYDAAGNRVAKTDFKNQTTTYDYNSMDRRVGIHADDREVALAYTPTGRRSQVTVQPGSTGLQVGTTAWTYDARDRLTEVEYPDGQGIQYEYDAAGNRTALTTATGTTTYAFDALNRLSSVTAPDTGTTTYTYNTAGDLTRVAHPNGTEQVDTFDARHRLVSRVNQRTDGTIITEHHYTLSDDNRRLALSEADGRFTEWTYDALDRLVEERVTDSVRGDRVTTFEYDTVGNRLRRETICDSEPCSGELTAGVTTYTYDDNDRLLSETRPAGTTTYGWDANGNQVEKSAPEGLTAYSYNTDNRLVGAQTPAHGLAFAYDLEGIRQSQTQDGATTDYLTDANRAYAQVIEKRNEDGALQASYVHGHDLLSQARGSSVSFYHIDGLGSTRALTDAAGNATDEYGYSGYGLATYQSGASVNSYRYTGEQYEAELNQYYLRARYYQPGAGQFMAMDTFPGIQSKPVSLHRYQYADFNPVANIDPSGQITITQFSVGTGIAAVLANSAITGYSFGRATGDSDGLPDGVTISLRGSVAKGLGISGGADLVYDFGTGELWGFWALEGNIAPLTVFKPQPKIDFEATAGFAWNMTSPDQFAGAGASATWPLSSAHLLAKARGISTQARGGFWGFISQTAKLAKRRANYSIQFGFSGFVKDGPAFARLGRGTSFTSNIFGLQDGRKITNTRGPLLRAVESMLSGMRGQDSPNALDQLIRRLESL